MYKYLIRVFVFTLAALTGFFATTILKHPSKQIDWTNAEVQIKGAITSGPALSESPDDELLPSSLSPYDIESFINNHPDGDLTKLWKALGTGPGQFENEGSNADYFPAKCETCKAETFEYDLDNTPGNEVLLRIGIDFSPACRYLIFKYVTNRWKLLGHVDASAKYRRPQHTVVLSGGLTWLSIQSQGASGSGVASYFDRVFLVRPTGVSEGIAYTSEAYQSGYDGRPTISVSGRIINCTLVNQTITADIDYFVEYSATAPSNADKSIALFSKRQKARYIKRLGSRTQALDRAHSDAPKTELEAVYNVDSLSNEASLKYNYRELSEIATGRNPIKKDWLRRFLKICANSAEHRRLDRMLAQ